jgi:hypothetical protein
MRSIAKGATDQSTVIRIVDATDGTPETGVTSATTGLSLSYRREGGTVVSITVSDLTALNDAHSDGGLLHIGAGYYRLDVPDAAFATGADGVLIFGAVTDMVVLGTYHPLVGYDPANGTIALTTAAIDAIFNRAFADIETANPTATTDRTLLQALRFLRNRWFVTSGTLTVTKEDDSTSAWTAAVTTNPSAEPVTGVDPADS